MADCNACIADKKYCEYCRDNPIYPQKSYYKAYEPFCPFGYIDCIHDPNYISWLNPDKYVEHFRIDCLEEYEKGAYLGICPGYRYENEN